MMPSAIHVTFLKFRKSMQTEAADLSQNVAYDKDESNDSEEGNKRVQ